MKKAIITTMAALATTALSAQESQTAYNFLRLPVSAHAAAVGGDNVTIVEDDAALMFSNPALLSSVSDKTIGLNVMTYMAGATTASATFNRTVGERASWAVSGQYMNYGKMRHTDANNLGLNYYDPNHDWSLSVVAKNLGGQLKAYDDEYDPMPIDIQIGASKRLAHTPLRVSATLVDLTHWNYRFFNHLVLGVDASISQNFWLGLGYNFRRADEMEINTTEGGSTHLAGFSVGAGLSLNRFKVNLAYGKYHVSSSSLMLNLAFSL